MVLSAGLRLASDRCSVIVVGSWNQAIFTPEWVGRKLFPEAAHLGLEVSLGPIFATRISNKVVTLVVTPAHVQVLPVETSDSGFAGVEATATKLMLALPETPVRAFGMNFGFVVEGECEGVNRVLGPPDQAQLAEFSAKVEATRLSRRLAVQGEIVNFEISRTLGAPAQIDINFHHDVLTCDRVNKLLEGNLLARKATAFSLVKHLYGLKEG